MTPGVAYLWPPQGRHEANVGISIQILPSAFYVVTLEDGSWGDYLCQRVAFLDNFSPSLWAQPLIRGGTNAFGTSLKYPYHYSLYSLFFMEIISFLAFGSLFVLAHGHPVYGDQLPLDYVKFPFQSIYRSGNGEGELPSPLWKYRPYYSSVTGDSIFSGITTFAKLPWVQCLTRDRETPFDIAFIGAPFVSPLSIR